MRVVRCSECERWVVRKKKCCSCKKRLIVADIQDISGVEERAIVDGVLRMMVIAQWPPSKKGGFTSVYAATVLDAVEILQDRNYDTVEPCRDGDAEAIRLDGKVHRVFDFEDKEWQGGILGHLQGIRPLPARSRKGARAYRRFS